MTAVHDVLKNEIVPIPDPDARLKDSDTLLPAGRNGDLASGAKVR